jgi:hypothetical protein
VIRLRLTKSSLHPVSDPFGNQFDKIFADRLCEAEELFRSVMLPSVSNGTAWVTLFLQRIKQALHGIMDVKFLLAAFKKSSLDFTE